MESSLAVLLECRDHRTEVEKYLTSSGWLTTNELTTAPDLHFVNDPETNLTIERVRDLLQEVTLKPYQGDTSYFVIYRIDAASLPAQNALLKVLEEPPQHVQFLLTTEHLDRVLPTIQSRCRVEKRGNETHPTEIDTHTAAATYQQLQTATYTDIFTLSEQYKEREEASALIKQLIQYLHAQQHTHPSQATLHHLQRLLHTQELLSKNVNVRLALEECFLALR